MTELEKFYQSFNNEISAQQFSAVDGGTQEQAFTRCCLDMLSQSNETENAVLVYDEKGFGTKLQHKINGYAISDSCETIDLFISVYEPSIHIEQIEKAKIERACTRIVNFFSKAFLHNYVNEIAETASVFEFAYQLANSEEIRNNLIRINAYILTNKKYLGDYPLSKEIDNYKIYFNVIDVDKLYSLSSQSRLPIQLDFDEQNVSVSCLEIPNNSEEYQAFMTYMPGDFLADLYDQYGFKLLEQNIRSFLQFRGGINRGIKETVLRNPKMFFAYNNGLSATAESIELDESGHKIKKIGNLQIVNGGQTTATLFYVSKEAGNNLKDVLVPVKISVIKDLEHSYEIVKSISKYANTQNKINDSDLSANDPVLIEIENLSRYMLTPITKDSSIQHYWFFDRISKQYETILAKITAHSSGKKTSRKSEKKSFSLKNPKSCKFSKYELAKYYNSYFELMDDGKIIVGPHCVVDGNEVNFRAFRDYVMPILTVDSTFYEDLIAKAILFKSVDKRHGTKRDKKPPIGDMKQVMVPYSIALLRIATNGCLDLQKIWKNQCLSDELSDYMYNLMVKLNQFLKDNAKRSNIIEWATKEDCWIFVKENFEIPSIESIQNDIADKSVIESRYKKDDNTDTELFDLQSNLIKSIDYSVWKEISEWGKDSRCLSLYNQNAADNIAHKLQYDYDLNKREVEIGISIYEIVCRNNYDLLVSTDQNDDETLEDEYVASMLAWDKTLILLESWQIKIIQQSIKLKTFSKVRLAELRLINKHLRQYGYVS